MKKFRLKLSPVLLILLILVALLSLGGAVWNVYNVFALKGLELVKVISYVLITILTLAIFVLSLSVPLFGRYMIKDGKLAVYFGFISSKSNIKDIVSITHFKISNKLVVYFSDAKYSVIIISPNDYENFILSIREVNPAILYDSKTDGEDTPN